MGTYRVSAVAQIYAIRFFQGFFEASSFVGTHYILGSWYTESGSAPPHPTVCDRLMRRVQNWPSAAESLPRRGWPAPSSRACCSRRSTRTCTAWAGLPAGDGFLSSVAPSHRGPGEERLTSLSDGLCHNAANSRVRLRVLPRHARNHQGLSVRPSVCLSTPAQRCNTSSV